MESISRVKILASTNIRPSRIVEKQTIKSEFFVFHPLYPLPYTNEKTTNYRNDHLC